MSRREVEEPHIDEYGAEAHPAWGTISAHRVSYGPPGTHLFDSEIRHGRTVILRIDTATRKRGLSQDWIHGADVGGIVEVELSEAQWASFVSSMNTSGVPCTIRHREHRAVPTFPHSPSLAKTMMETHQAAATAFGEILEALKELEELEQGESTPKQRREPLRNLKIRIQNATPNVDYAGRQLVKQAEAVVEKARSDIEAMVTETAKRLAIDAGDMKGLVALDVSLSRKTCPSCGHEAHGSVCLNLQSDNDCECSMVSKVAELGS